MEMPLSFVFDLGWIFFVTWGAILAAVSVIAFRRDFLPMNEPHPGRSEHQ